MTVRKEREISTYKGASKRAIEREQRGKREANKAIKGQLRENNDEGSRKV